MADITITISDTAKDWIEAQARDGGFANVGEFVSDLVIRERIRLGEDLSLDEVRQMVQTSRDSGISARSVDEIFAEAEKIVARQKIARG
jgi:antitoxin ParD1/3/4